MSDELNKFSAMCKHFGPSWMQRHIVEATGKHIPFQDVWDMCEGFGWKIKEIDDDN